MDIKNLFHLEIVADSKNPQNDRITTFKLTYPRIIHAELMTHRMFSRNAASSRAVPAKKMIQMVRDNMFIPLAFQKEHKGMQGSEYFEGDQLKKAIQLWCDAAESALEHSEKMRVFGITKQLTNRVLEPYQYYQVLVTATEWENFFKLRCPQYEYYLGNKLIGTYRSEKDLAKNKSIHKPWTSLQKAENSTSQAEIHIQAIAELMWDAYNESIPKELKAGEWHIPFGDNLTDLHLLPYELAPAATTQEFVQKLKVKIATARCARISYETLGDNPKIDYEADLKLHDILVKNGHASPLEHCALATNDSNWYGNFKGWNQYRKILEFKNLL
jgi:thymidylate synthase ThyX